MTLQKQMNNLTDTEKAQLKEIIDAYFLTDKQQ